MLIKIFACCISCFMYCATPAVSGWQKVQVPHPESNSGMLVIQTKGQASAGEGCRESILYLAGIPNSGRFTLGIFIGDLDKEWSGIPWDDFRGPDLDEAALKATPLEVTLDLGDHKVISNYRILVSGVLLPEQDVGQMGEGILIGSSEATPKGISMKALCQLMATGYKGINFRLKFTKAKKEINIRVSSEKSSPVLSEFLSLIH